MLSDSIVRSRLLLLRHLRTPVAQTWCSYHTIGVHVVVAGGDILEGVSWFQSRCTLVLFSSRYGLA